MSVYLIMLCFMLVIKQTTLDILVMLNYKQTV